jgi:hypothetical protein
MPRIRPHVVLLAAALAACADGIVVQCDCVAPPALAVIYGRVTDPAGAPAPGARVRAEYALAGCEQVLEPVAEVQAGADGRYRAQLAVYFGDPAGPHCLRAFATPPAQSTLLGSDTVPFEVALHRMPPLDSVQVDLVLRAP